MRHPSLLLTIGLLLACSTPCNSDDLREGPIARAPAEAGIGRLLPGLETTTIDGTTVPLRPRSDELATVIAFTSTTCPLSQKFAPLLGRMSHASTDGTVRWIFLDVTGSDTPEDLAEFARTHSFKGDLVHDKGLRHAAALGASSTAEAILIDRTGTIRYRGCVDDRYGIGYALDEPRITPLADAIDAVLAGKQVQFSATTAPGCELSLGGEVPGESTPTYHGSISRIVQANCLECHRTGGVAPFALETYDEVRANAGMIRRVVSRGVMPPWFAADDARHDFGPFANDRSLPESDIEAIIRWTREGRPEGDPSDAPLPSTFAASWTIGTPDRVIQIPQPSSIKAEGRMPYAEIRVDAHIDEDMWIRGWEVMPTNRAVVHHALIFVIPKGTQRKFTATDGFFAAYVPGNGATIYPDGHAKLLPAGSDLHFQIHYTPNGTATTEQMKLGLLLTDGEPRHQVRTVGISDRRIHIPAGAPAHVESATLEIPANVQVVSITPHMHIRGSAFKCTVEEPDGETRTLLDVPEYDFNWQLRYQFAEAPLLAKGSVVTIEGTFDNSSANPANPDPRKSVRWGRQTDDEMLIGYVEYWLADRDDPDDLDRTSDDRLYSAQARRLIAKWDSDGDGRLSRREVPENRRLQFALMDLDGDGYIAEQEFVQASRQLAR